MTAGQVDRAPRMCRTPPRPRAARRSHRPHRGPPRGRAAVTGGRVAQHVCVDGGNGCGRGGRGAWGGRDGALELAAASHAARLAFCTSAKLTARPHLAHQAASSLCCCLCSWRRPATTRSCSASARRAATLRCSRCARRPTSRARASARRGGRSGARRRCRGGRAALSGGARARAVAGSQPARCAADCVARASPAGRPPMQVPPRAGAVRPLPRHLPHVLNHAQR